ncbi:MAG: leucine-rich repeat protein [Lachnospiraceae bacterium]|nr:leucine-rich repeat protein [Lachnospiraceae bacterium]
MDEKKIIYKSIDEQLAEDERREAAKVDASRRSPGKAVEKAVTGTKSSNGPRKGRGKLRLKKSVRRTIGSLMLATSVVVAAVPVGGVSADSSGVYKGSPKTVNDFSPLAEDVKNNITPDYSDTDIKGGFPIIAELDDDGVNYKKREIGGRMFYVVESSGYSSFENVRPIYSLNIKKGYINKYFETVGSDDVYIPPSGRLNLVTGYVNENEAGFETDTDGTKYKKWEYDGRLYKLQIFKKTLGDNNKQYYGKKLSIYDKIEVITHQVVFYDEDGDPWAYRTVRHGEVVTDIPAFPESTKGGTNPYWSPKPADTPITADNAEFHIKYTYPTPTASPKESALGPEETTEPLTVTEEAGSDISEGTSEGGIESDTTSTLDSEDGVEASEEPEGNESSASDSNENIIEESHEIESADSGEFGLTGILLQWYPDESGTEYKDDPTEEYYVCDEYASISNICNEAFINTSNVRIVDLPTNIRNIGNKSFYGSGVTSITLGDGLQSVGASAFENCQDLTTATFSNNMSLQNIGAKAFANSGLTTMTKEDGAGVSIPYTVKMIGSGAFLGTKMSSLDFSNVSNCQVGNCAFAQCKSLTNVNLNYRDGTQLTISNLGGNGATLEKAKGLFCEDDLLAEATMPKGFTGELSEGFFGSCESFNHIIFMDGNGTFHENEFDAYQITVEGPKPSSLDATTPLSFASSMDEKNDYVYRYYDDNDGHLHEIATENGYEVPIGDYDFFDDDYKNASSTVKSKRFTFDVDETNGYSISNYYDKGSTRVDLDIGNNIGRRNDGDIPILAIGNGVFENDTAIHYLQLNSNLNSIGDSAFRSTKIEKLWANVDGTAFGANSFADNSVLERATFAYGGEGGSSLGSNSFGNTPLLNNVDFYDDNLTTGDKSLYARFFAGSIASDAFYTNGRTEEITFKGPMLESYAPYEFAIDSLSKISNNQIYTKYYSGNPWNLTAQYTVEAFTKNNPVSGKDVKYSGVCLLNYPNMSSKMDTDDIESASGTVTVTDLEAKSASSRTTMEQDCITYTRDLTIPYGIDYIDIAKTKINNYSSDYYVFDDSDDLYKKTSLTDPTYTHVKVGGNYYYMFKYNPDITSVTFASGGVSEFPDRMFEGAQYLENVTFEGDVTNLGKLPFYMPDTEAFSTKYSVYDPNSFPHLGPGAASDDDDFQCKSRLESVYFKGEGTSSSADNELYYSSTDSYGFSTGIIKGNDGSRVQVVQIVPSRGDTCGSESITADELADVDAYADYAARDCDAIKTVVFPEDGCEISYGCFMDCDRLKNVTMPNQFTSVGNKAFAGISTNMDVTFPYNNVNLKELPFESSSKDGLTMPDVTFHVHNDAEYLMDYADKNANINYVTIADAIKLTYRDRYDDTYYQVVEAQANGYTFGSNYPPSVLPSYGGKNPSTWSGIDKNGNTVNWNTDVLTTDTTFTSVYGSTDEKVKVYFVDYNGDPIKTVTLNLGSILTADKMPSVPEHVGMKFLYWSPNLEGEEITENVTVTAKYESSSTTSTTSTTSSTGGGTTSGGTTSSTTSKSSSSSSSSRSSSSSSSSTALPVFVNSQDAGAAAPVSAAGVNSTVYVGEGSGSGSTGSGSGSGNGRGSGNTTVISTAGGITDTGKISATVNGSSDNYVVKITQTQEADDAGLSALHGKYGDDISAIRYLPFDISLYDSTGTNKISPVPEGVSVSITMPIPDDLAIYGGNAKIASTAGGVLDPMTPRFTVINGVPCMTYTCTHFSPYMVWVDTANLTEAGIMDATPKTADGIHPKWFLCFGLAAIAVVMFLKKDPEEYLKKKAA